MIKKDYRFYFIAFLLLTGIIFFCLPAIKIFADGLNVTYPKLPNNSTPITSQSSLPEYLKYLFDFGMFAGGIALIISLAIAGVYYFISPAVASARAKAKDQMFGAISGFVLLMLTYLIITTINPALSFFYIPPLQPISPPASTQPPPQPGVYVYKTSDCSSPPDPLINTSPTYSLKTLNNQIKSAKIVQDQQNSISYIGILFQKSTFWGSCYYINPYTSCDQQVLWQRSPFATSVAIYQYNYSNYSGGITFYRNSFFDPSGGSFQVSGAQTSQIYFSAIKDLNYMKNQNGNPNNPDDCTVPKEKMDCVAWDGNGACTKRKCPDLAGENIGSIKINGNYVVLLVYYDPSDNPKGPWSMCQAFPSPDDKAKTGPNKINWEVINNQSRVPNYVVIFPVVDNTNPDKTTP